MVEGKYCWSITDEGPFRGEYDTRKDALERARREVIDSDLPLPRVVWTGVSQDISLSDLVSAEGMMETAYEHAVDQHGEVAEEWLWVPSAAAAEGLKELLDRWAKEHHLSPNFWNVGDVEEHDA